jgi:hypothetical protein
MKGNDSAEYLSKLPLNELYSKLSVTVETQVTGFRRGQIRRARSQSLGRRVFQRWSNVLHQFVCRPTKEDKALRTSILIAMTVRDASGINALAHVLSDSFGLTAQLAVLIAALLVRLVIASAAEEVCQAWAKTLKVSGSQVKRGTVRNLDSPERK